MQTPHAPQKAVSSLTGLRELQTHLCHLTCFQLLGQSRLAMEETLASVTTPATQALGHLLSVNQPANHSTVFRPSLKVGFNQAGRYTSTREVGVWGLEVCQPRLLHKLKLHEVIRRVQLPSV